MKVLIVNKFLYPNGGSETYIFEIGKQFHKMGHEVQYFGMEHERRVVGNRVESYTSNMNFHTGKLAKLLYPFKIVYSFEARKKIRKVLEDFQPDVVHLNNINFQITPSIIDEIRHFEKKKNVKIKIVFTAHDYQWICPNHMLYIPHKNQICENCILSGYKECTKNRCIHGSKVKSLLGTIEAWVYKTRKTYEKVDCIICPSEFMKKKLETNSQLKDKLVVLHNFITSEIDKETLVQKKDYVLYFGRYALEKGISTLLEVCKSLPEIKFVFAGSGPLGDEVKTVSNVEERGFVEGKELENLIREAKFSIYPSEWYENCPFSIMESQMYGTPVIGANIGGIPELIRDGENGALFESGSVSQLRNKIVELWESEKLLSEYTENCLQISYDSVEQYCIELLKLYRCV